MKRKIKLILGTCLIFIMFSNFAVQINAEDTLKSLQEKYRISYNNFTKALKECADQKTLDQLSEQCKGDYEEYQRVLNGVEVSTKSTKNPVPKQKNAANIVSQPITQATEKTIIQDQLPFSYKQTQINYNEKSMTTYIPVFNPIQSKNFLDFKIPNKTTPKRINDNGITLAKRAESKETPGFSYTELPSDEELLIGTSPIEKDEKTKAMLELRKIEKNIKDPNYDENDYKNDIRVFCLTFSKHQDLCALIRFIGVEGTISRSWAAVTANAYYQPAALETKFYIKTLLNEIKNYYSSYNKTAIVSYVNGRVSDRLKMLEPYIKSHVANIDSRILEAIEYAKFQRKSAEDFLKQTFSIYEVSNVNSLRNRITYVRDSVFGTYSDLAQAYYLTGKYDQLEALKTEIKTYYDSINSNLNIKYKDSNGNEQSMQITVYKNPYTILAANNNITVAKIRSISFDENTRYTYDDIKNDSDYAFKYIDGIPHKDEEIDPNAYSYLVNSEKKRADFFRQKPEVTAISINSSDRTPTTYETIYDSEKPYFVNFQVKSIIYNGEMIFHYPLKLMLCSSGSKQQKIVTVKQSTLFFEYSYLFQPSNGDSYGEKLINNATDKTGLKHSVCIADGILKYLEENWDNPDIAPNPFKSITKSKFFQNFLGQGIVDIKHEKFSSNKMPITTSFLNSMGFDAIDVSVVNSEIPKKFLYCQNQADWFVFQVHGIQGLNAISLDTGSDNINYYLDTWLIDKLNPITSKIKFAILSSCGLLKIDYIVKNDGSIIFPKASASIPGIILRKKIGDKTALLGYVESINGYTSSTLLEDLIIYLESLNPDDIVYPYTEIFQEKIIRYWLSAHRMRFEKSLKEFRPYVYQNTIQTEVTFSFEKYKYSKMACAILNNKFYEMISQADALKKRKHKDISGRYMMNTLDISPALNN